LRTESASKVFHSQSEQHHAYNKRKIDTLHNRDNFADHVLEKNESGDSVPNSRNLETSPLNIPSVFANTESTEYMEESYNGESSYFALEDAFNGINGSASFNLVGLYHY